MTFGFSAETLAQAAWQAKQVMKPKNQLPLLELCMKFTLLLSFYAQLHRGWLVFAHHLLRVMDSLPRAP